MLILKATLPHPVSVNRTYKTGRGHFYKSAEADDWSQLAMLELRRQGWRRLPDGDYKLHVYCRLLTVRHDIDAGIKSTLDIIQAALGVNDAHVSRLTIDKEHVAADSQRMELTVTVCEADDAGIFEGRAGAPAA